MPFCVVLQNMAVLEATSLTTLIPERQRGVYLRVRHTVGAAGLLLHVTAALAAPLRTDVADTLRRAEHTCGAEQAHA